MNIIYAWGIVRCHVRFPQGVDRVIDDSLLHITPHDQKPLLWCHPEFLREVCVITYPPILSALQMGPNVNPVHPPTGFYRFQQLNRKGKRAEGSVSARTTIFLGWVTQLNNPTYGSKWSIQLDRILGKMILWHLPRG